MLYSPDTKHKIQKALGELLDETNVKRLKKELKSKHNGHAEYDRENKKVVIKSIFDDLELNDLVVFKNGRQIEKAVVTAKGKDGITGRDINQEQVRLLYDDIVGFIPRRQK